jgi:hypothetical protein
VEDSTALIAGKREEGDLRWQAQPEFSILSWLDFRWINSMWIDLQFVNRIEPAQLISVRREHKN